VRARNVLRLPLVGIALLVGAGVLVWFLVRRAPAAVRDVIARLLPGELGRAAFLDLVRDEVQRQLGELRPDLGELELGRAAALLAAQAGFETGYGRSPAWRKGWNGWNVTAGSWTGPVTVAGDTEPNAAGDYVRIVARFRAYETLADAVSDMLSLLSWPRYRAARDRLLAGDAAGYAQRLRDDDPATVQREGGFFTAPLAEYRAGLEAALAQVPA
jgi:hypothetical protein